MMDEQDMIKVEFNIPTDQSVDTPKIIKVIEG